MVMLAVTVTGVILISQNLHRDLSKIIFTHCTASKKSMQDSLDEVELS